jgi:hypothetical protein
MASAKSPAPAPAGPAWRRIEPTLDAAGQPVEVLAPCGGSWQRDADGGLTPRDESTARDAGLINTPTADAPVAANLE